MHHNLASHHVDNVRHPEMSAKNKCNVPSPCSISDEGLQGVQNHIEELGPNEMELKPQKCDLEEEELEKALKEINRSNRRIIKQTFVSDILKIPDHIEPKIEEAFNENTKLAALQTVSNHSLVCRTNEKEDGGECDEDEWETMYDETGNCLHSRTLEELEQKVGKVKLEIPQVDDSVYQTKQELLDDQEYPNVLEVSNFPMEFKLQDLYMMFSEYRESGLDIKWVDDSHALAVFRDAKIAAEVLTKGHLFAVIKPLTEATPGSQLKAKKCGPTLQPYRERPKTSMALARRLIVGALGVRLETAASQRENEKMILKAAKEQKLLAAKQREEAWEN